MTEKKRDYRELEAEINEEKARAEMHAIHAAVEALSEFPILIPLQIKVHKWTIPMPYTVNVSRLLRRLLVEERKAVAVAIAERKRLRLAMRAESSD